MVKGYWVNETEEFNHHPIWPFSHPIVGLQEQVDQVLSIHRNQNTSIAIIPPAGHSSGVGKTTLAYFAAQEGLEKGLYKWVMWLPCAFKVSNIDKLREIEVSPVDGDSDIVANLQDMAGGLVVLDDLRFAISYDEITRLFPSNYVITTTELETTVIQWKKIIVPTPSKSAGIQMLQNMLGNPTDFSDNLPKFQNIAEFVAYNPLALLITANYILESGYTKGSISELEDNLSLINLQSNPFAELDGMEVSEHYSLDFAFLAGSHLSGYSWHNIDQGAIRFGNQSEWLQTIFENGLLLPSNLALSQLESLHLVRDGEAIEIINQPLEPKLVVDYVPIIAWSQKAFPVATLPFLLSARRKMARTALREELFEHTQKWIHIGIDCATKAHNVAEIIQQLQFKRQLYSEGSEAERVYLEGLVADARELGSQNFAALTLMILGNNYLYNRLIPNALALYREALLFCEPNTFLDAQINLLIGQILNSNQDTNLAQEPLKRAYRIFKSLGETSNVILTELLIGKSYFDIKDIRQSLVYFERGSRRVDSWLESVKFDQNRISDLASHVISKQKWSFLNDLVDEANEAVIWLKMHVCSMMMHMYIGMLTSGNFEYAQTHLKEALKQSIFLQSTMNQATTLYLTGSLHLKHNLVEEAITAFEACQDIYKRYGSKVGEIVSLIHLSNAVYLKSKEAGIQLAVSAVEKSISWGVDYMVEITESNFEKMKGV